MFIRIKFQSFHLKYFFVEFNFFFFFFYKFDFKPLNIFILNIPKNIKKYCVIKSPFVSKNGKEHFKLEFLLFIFYLKFAKILFYIFYKKKLFSIIILYYFYIKFIYIENFCTKNLYVN